MINRWNQLDHGVVDASSINAFKGCLNKIRETRMGFLWTDPPSPRPRRWVFWLVRPHKVSYKVSLHAAIIGYTESRQSRAEQN